MSSAAEIDFDKSAVASKNNESRAQAAGDVALVLIALVAAWQALHLYAGSVALPSPLDTARFAIKLLSQPRFWGQLTSTLETFFLAITIALAGGLLIGVLFGLSRGMAQLFEPILIALYSIPKVTLYQMILLLFGIGLSAKVAFGVLHGIVPMIIFTMDAIRNLKLSFLRTAAAMRMSTAATIRYIILPAAVPEVVSGLRVGFSVTILGVLVGEMFSSKQGLGFMIMNAINLSDVDTMMAVALILFVLAATGNALLLALDRHLHKRF